MRWRSILLALLLSSTSAHAYTDNDKTLAVALLWLDKCDLGLYKVLLPTTFQRSLMTLAKPRSEEVVEALKDIEFEVLQRGPDDKTTWMLWCHPLAPMIERLAYQHCTAIAPPENCYIRDR